MHWGGIIRLLALSVWFLATAHCRLAALPELEFLACAHDDSPAHAPVSSNADGCESVESGSYRPEEPFAFQEPWLDPDGLLDAPPDPLRFVGDHRFQLRLSEERDLWEFEPWQFRLRAAGHPRSPSLRA